MLGAFANHGTGYAYISRKLQICYSLKAEMRLNGYRISEVILTPPGAMLGGFFSGPEVTHAPSPPVKRPFDGGVSLGRLPGPLSGRRMGAARPSGAPFLLLL